MFVGNISNSKKNSAKILPLTCIKGKKKGKGHPCTGTEALYRPYGP